MSSRQPFQRVRQFACWVCGQELVVLVGIVLLTAGLWAFAEIADQVQDGDSRSIDRSLLLAFRNPADVTDPGGPGWLEEMARDATALGGVGVLTLVTLAVCGYLLLQQRPGAALFVLTAVAGALIVSQLLKTQFARPRPDLVPHGSYVYTASFPSGHAMMSTATYLTLAALLAREHSGRRFKTFFLTLAVLLSIVVGISRVYLGVHWPTDVLAGWTLGACWAILCCLIARRLQRRGEGGNRPLSGAATKGG